MLSRLLPASLRGRLLLGAVLALALLAAAFDATWFRPLIQHHVQQRSGRQVDFETLRLGLDTSLQPTVRLTQLQVQNAAWAAPRPLVRAAELGFTLSWESLWADTIVLTRLTLVDAELDLERQADGLRNWRLTRPYDRGPGRVRVLALDAQRTRARVVHRGMALEVALQSTPLQTRAAAPQAAFAAPPTEPPLTRSVSFQGSSRGVPFQGQAEVSDVVTLFDTGQPFALRGEVRSANAWLRAEGRLSDVLGSAALDLQVLLDSRRADELPSALGFSPSPLALPARLQGRLHKEGRHWRLSALQARVGSSDASGSLAFRERSAEGTRPALRAQLSSTRVDWAALREATGAGPAGKADATPAASATPLSAHRWQQIDAEIDWQIETLAGVLPTPLGAFSAKARLDQGRLRVAPLSFGIYGGRASGSLGLDTRGSPPSATLALGLQGLQLARLPHGRAGGETLAGGLDLRVALRSQGASMAALRAAAAGTVEASLVRASLPGTLEAKLGLDGGRWLRAALGSTERVPITCSVLMLDLADGKGRLRRLELETDRLSVSGTGSLDLAQQQLDMVLTPHRKQAALLALDRSLRVTGWPGRLGTKLVEQASGPQAGRGCAAARENTPTGASPQPPSAAPAR